MEERKEFGQEIVETYHQGQYREVVEVYSRPLPGHECPQAEDSGLPARRRGRRKGLVVFLICLAVAAVLAIAAALLAGRHNGAQSGSETAEPAAKEIAIPAYPTGQGVTLPLVRDHGGTLTIQEVYRQVNPAVVTVMVGVGEGMAVGTGVLFTEDGYVITNHHVLESGESCAVATADGYTYPAKYVASDAANDLAVLKVDVEGAFPLEFPAAEFGDSDLLTVGDPVYAIGNPLGLELRGTLTDGIVSAINRDVWVDGRTMTLIQTNAALNEGNSGGPLINAYGQVVGINVIKMTSKYRNVEGLGFAIPSSDMQRIINDLLTWGELQPEPVFGLMVMTIADSPAEGVEGLLVDEVTAGGAADLAGIRKGDYILTADGQPLTTSQELLRIRRQHYLGDELTMTLWRNGELLEVTLRLNDAEETVDEAPWYVES